MKIGQAIDTNIFNVYHSAHGLKGEKERGKERIGCYLFTFFPQCEGVIIENNVLGNNYGTWAIHSPTIGSKEAAVSHYMPMLADMANNRIREVEARLSSLASLYKAQPAKH